MVKTQDTYFQQEYKKKKKCYAFPIQESEILFFQFSWSIAQTPKHTLGCNEDGGRLNSHTQKIHQPRVPFLFVFISSKLPVISFIFSYILSIGGKFSWLKIQKAQKGVQWTILLPGISYQSSEPIQSIDFLSILPKIFYTNNLYYI